MEPFWEAVYQDPEADDPFGEASAEVVEIGGSLPTGSRILDLGCGAGRNAIPLARLGHHVVAVDRSAAATAALRRRAGDLSIDIVTADLGSFALQGPYDLILAHGVLHLIPPEARDDLIGRMQRHTVEGGCNIVAVFTDRLPSPEDLAPFTVGLFREGEIFEFYDGWEAIDRQTYILEDEHPGGIRHRHPINKLVASKPAGGAHRAADRPG